MFSFKFPIFALTLGSFIAFFNIYKEKSIKIRHFRNMSFMLNIIIKYKWKRGL